MTQPLRIALAGLGTVGAGVVKLLDANRALIERRAGRPIVITAISARDRTRDRGVDLSAFAWADDTASLAARISPRTALPSRFFPSQRKALSLTVRVFFLDGVAILVIFPLDVRGAQNLVKRGNTLFNFKQAGFAQALDSLAFRLDG